MRMEYSTVTYSGRDEDGYPIVQTRSLGDQGGAPFSLEHPYGFYSRPHDPETGEGGGYCGVLVGGDGSTRVGWLQSDPRFLQMIPLLNKGSSCNYVVYRDGDEWKPSFLYIDGADGTLQFYREYGNGAITMLVGRDGGGEPNIELRQHDGSIITMFDGKIVMKSPSGATFITISDDGILLKGNLTMAGAIAQIAGVALAKAAPTIATLNAIGVHLTALTTAVSTLSDPATATALGNSLALLQSALVANNLLIPTTATKGQ